MVELFQSRLASRRPSLPFSQHMQCRPDHPPESGSSASSESGRTASSIPLRSLALLGWLVRATAEAPYIEIWPRADW